MTLKIHNIMYDHTQEFRTYPAGVLSIDTTTRAIHVHDGLTPNGWVMPTTADLADYALKDLTNVTQESMNNALNAFGALNLNKSDPLGTTQKDNFWSQVGGTALKSGAEVPEKNYLYVDSKTKNIQAGDISSISYWGLDYTKGKSRLVGTSYSPDYPAFVVVAGTVSGGTRHTAYPCGVHFYVNDEDIPWANIGQLGGSHAIWSSFPVSIMLPIVPGQTYKLVAQTPFNALRYTEFPAIGVFHKAASS